VILSDRSLREAIAAGRLVIDPLDDDAIQPSSIDVRLDNRFPGLLHGAAIPYIDVKQPMEDLTELVEVKPTTRSSSTRGSSCSGRPWSRWGSRRPGGPAGGKISLGRLGLMTHSTAGFLDPGFVGHVTLELSNVANLPITLYPGCGSGRSRCSS
jgi:dCTP deaminase